MAQQPHGWLEASLIPHAHREAHARLAACCTAGLLDTDLKFIVWPPQTAPETHWHPCCGAPVSYPLVQKGVAHLGTGSTLRHLAERLRRQEPVRIAVLGSSAASVTSAGCTAKASAESQDFGGVGLRCPPGRGWARMFAEWLDAVWPAAGPTNHTVVALGRGGCGPDGWLECFQTHLPNIDIYLIEMGTLLRGDDHASFDALGGGEAPEPSAALERMLRKILAVRPAPAVVLVNLFAWCREGVAACMASDQALSANWSQVGRRWRHRDHRTAGYQAQLLNAFSASEGLNAPAATRPAGAQLDALRASEAAELLGRHYDVPVLSTRDALYDAIRSGGEDFFEWATPHLTYTNSFRDEPRPGYRMQALIASMLVEAVTNAAMRGSSGHHAGGATSPPFSVLISEARTIHACVLAQCMRAYPSFVHASNALAYACRSCSHGVCYAGPLMSSSRSLPPPLHAWNGTISTSETRACFAFGFERSYWDAANWLYALRAAPPTLRSTGWARASVSLESPVTGGRLRKTGLRANRSSGAHMEIEIDTSLATAPGLATVQLIFARAAGGMGEELLTVRCSSGCSCKELRITDAITEGITDGHADVLATDAQKLRRRGGQLSLRQLAPQLQSQWAAVEMAVRPAAVRPSSKRECRLVLTASQCDRCSSDLVLLELKVLDSRSA